MAEEEQGEQAPKKSNKMLFIIIGAVAFILIIVVVVLVLVLSGGDKKKEKGGEGGAPTHKQARAGGGGGKGGSSDYIKIGPIYDKFKPFVVNLISQGGRRYLKASIALEMSNPKMEEEVVKKSAVITNTIIDILSSKSVEEISTTRGKDRLRDEIAQKINVYLLDGYLKSVFFTTFVIQ